MRIEQSLPEWLFPLHATFTPGRLRAFYGNTFTPLRDYLNEHGHLGRGGEVVKRRARRNYHFFVLLPVLAELPIAGPVSPTKSDRLCGVILTNRLST